MKSVTSAQYDYQNVQSKTGSAVAKVLLINPHLKLQYDLLKSIILSSLSSEESLMENSG